MKRNLCFFPLLALCGFCLAKATSFEPHDFANYYFGASFFRDGVFDEAIYFPHIFNRMILNTGCSGIFASFAPNTPFTALVFLPFSFMKLATAKFLFNLISVGMLIYSIWRLAAYYRIPPLYIALIPVIFYIPIRNNILFGQLYFILFFLISESWIAYKENKLVKMAGFMAPAILLKLFPAIVVVLFLARKQWRPAAYVMAGCTFLLLISMWANGSAVWAFYFFEVLPKASHGEIATAFVDNYQSAFMFLKRIFIADAMENPAGSGHPIIFAGLLNAFKAALLIVGYFLSRTGRNCIFAFGYWIIAAILISPYGSTYTFVLMLIPFIAIAKSDLSVRKILLLTMLFLVCNIPVSFMMPLPMPLSYLRLLLLLAFTTVYTAPFIRFADVKFVTIGIAGIAAITMLVTQDVPVRSELMLKNGPVLTGAYSFAKSGLCYSFLDQAGEHEATIPMLFRTAEQAQIVNQNIMYHDKIIRTECGHKRLAVVLDGHTLIYLSDYGRGTGFFALRKTELR